MYKVPLPEIKEKILASEKITPIELEARIKEKITELSGLISEEGAAHIISNELGILLVEKQKERMKIKEIYAGMRNVATFGKVVRIFETREFTKGEGEKGKVGSALIGDESATIRVVFWNDQTKQLAGLKEDDIILVKDASVKENRGGKELHVGDRSEVVINPENLTVGIVRQGGNFQRKTIEQLQDGEEGTEIMGTVIQVFDPRFFLVCPQCAKKANEMNGAFECSQHGKVVPSVSYVMNLIMDDSTGTIRSVFWKNQTTRLLEKAEEEIASFKDNLSSFEEIKTDLLGEQLKLMGRVKRNEMFDRLEFTVQMVEKAKPEEEIARLEKVK
ncbi:MAG TPA: OB-fold nucleic acid binding domain-containing protein [Candidatus Nanoarchaeia archaeon]|nr:hypothetical protein [Candidatus Woesearchaeota archaeon]HIG93873.1 hypothetical protein [Candidatus Woesearchaeota archaeon]HIH12809.1 hypothetical protein [Candidatus Woesearchaeota archaeon]HLC71293.1 OB-fold nucleic acid binding domain-containing protein [Candidatus Nanoarchaeia archaeon]